jgi:hypothetical protein
MLIFPFVKKEGIWDLELTIKVDEKDLENLIDDLSKKGTIKIDLKDYEKDKNYEEIMKISKTIIAGAFVYIVVSSYCHTTSVYLDLYYIYKEGFKGILDPEIFNKYSKALIETKKVYIPGVETFPNNS